MTTLNTKITYNDFPNKSFGLLRTNPKLTSNVKLVVDSNDDIYLSSFSANKDLSSSEYKKFRLDSLGKYSHDVSRFYRTLPMSSRYDVMRENPDMSVYSEYSKQYENQYNLGAEFNSTKLYDEQYSFLAPLWLNKQIPEMFVVYRVEDSKYTNADVTNTNNHLGQNERIMEMLENASIVKTFDLRRNSKVGKYIRNHIEDPKMPKNALTFDFAEGEPCVYHGIDLFNGGFVSNEDYQYDDYIRYDGFEIDKADLISGGFERNGMVFANIINMEFLFDDIHSEKYKTYRYFGLYVDSIEEGTFECHSPSKNSISAKPDSVDVVYDLTATGLIGDDLLPHVNELNLPTLNYITDVLGGFYHIKNKASSLNNSMITEINNVDLFGGFKKKEGTISFDVRNRSFKSFIKIRVKDNPNHLDKVFVGNVYVMSDASFNMSDNIISADSSLPAGSSNDAMFSNQGTVGQVLAALSESIRFVTKDDMLNVEVVGDGIIIESFVKGPDKDMIVFGIYNNNLVDFIEYVDAKNDDVGLYSASGNITFTDWDIRTMLGGAGENQGLLIKSKDFGDVVVGDYLRVRDSNKYIKIKYISEHVISGYRRIILDGEADLPRDGVCEVFSKFRAGFGKFSAYDIKDLSFDFHRNTSDDIGELLLDTGGDALYDAVNGTSNMMWRALLDDAALQTLYPLNIPPVVSISEEELVNYNLDRFYNINSNIIDLSDTHRIPNMYSRLSENTTKENALDSRVVPYINEFEFTGLKNIRGGKYILNGSESHGVYNMSPNTSINGVSSNDANLEHFELNTISSNYNLISNGNVDLVVEHPSLINIKNGLLHAYNGAAYDKLDLTKLKDINFDYFSLFSTFNGYFSDYDTSTTPALTTAEWIDNEKIQKYSTFNNDTVYHRGLKYITNENLDSYKFMSILNITDDTSDLSSILRVVLNEKFKTLTLYIDMRYDSSVAIGKETLSIGNLYEILDLKDSSGVLIDTPIKSDFDFQGSTWPSISTPGENAILRASQASIDAGDAKFMSQFTKNDQGEYSYLLLLNTVSLLTYSLRILDVINDTELLVAGYPVDSGSVYDLTAPSFDGTDFTCTYQEGGNNAFRSLMDNITSRRIKERLSDFEGVEYIRVLDDGSEVLNDFKMKIVEPTEFVKQSTLMSVSDTDKPAAFSMISGSVGHEIVKKQPQYFVALKRFSGDYMPSTRNVITFDSIYNKHRLSISGADARELLIHGKFNGYGIAFESYKNNIKDYGILKNFYFHKVNDVEGSEIIKLSEHSEKTPRYPLVGEIAIDKKDLNLFDSKYTSEFFTRSFSGVESEKAHGTLSPIEVKSFMASTVMKVEDEYSLDLYNSYDVKDANRLEDILESGSNKYTINWFEDNERVFADVYVPNMIYDTLVADGILAKFSETVNPIYSYGDKSTVEDDLLEYIKHNISPRFIIEDVDVYVIESKEISTAFTQDISDIEGYSISKSHSIELFNEGQLGFRLVYMKKPGYKYDFKINVKIKA